MREVLLIHPSVPLSNDETFDARVDKDGGNDIFYVSVGWVQ